MFYFHLAGNRVVHAMLAIVRWMLAALGRLGRMFERSWRKVVPPQLTAAQLRRLQDMRVRAAAGSHAVETIDRAAAHAAVTALYDSLGLRPPACIVQLSSPMACQLAIGMLAEPMAPTIRRAIGRNLVAALGQPVGAAVAAAIDTLAARSTGIAGHLDWMRLRAAQSEAPLNTVLPRVLDRFSWRIANEIFGTSRMLGMLRGQPDRVAVHIETQLADDPRNQFLETDWQRLWTENLRANVWQPVWTKFGDEILADAGAALGATTTAAAGEAIWRAIAETMIADRNVADILSARHSWRRLHRPTLFQGAMDTAWLAECAFVEEQGLRFNRSARAYLDAYRGYARAAGWAYLYRDIAFVCDRPAAIAVDGQGRMHNGEGPAVRFRDGWSTFAWKGLEMPAWIIRAPERIGLSAIEREPRIEVRRAMIERIGAARYVALGGARLVAEDADGKLWKRRGWGEGEGAFEWAAVEVVNGSPEPDGSRRHYFLQVPPHVASAREAVAWTYGLSARQYAQLTRRT